MTGWEPGAPGVLALPSGRLVRGRGARGAPPDDLPAEFRLVLRGRRPRDSGVRWLRWPDFGLPHDPVDAADAFQEVLQRAGGERVDVVCGGGLGRTGTALACVAVLDGVPPQRAVEFVRRGYHPRAVETPWQRRFVERLRP